jgi:hypothetical protein
MYFLLTGIGLLATIIGLFWLKDRLKSSLLSRIVYSELIARIAVVGAAFVVIGGLLLLARIAE